MSFTGSDGTRGARQPQGKVALWLNKQMMRRVRRTGRAMGFNALVLTTVGRKTGAERSSPVGWFPGPDGTWLIVASANGAARNPAWYHNLAAHPDRARIETAGQSAAVTAEELHGTERDDAWRQIVTAAPRFGKYEQQTDRVIPIIRLTRRPA
jgi:deazaflavin-dependent oxidoreductase (nitroreductase family)